MDNSRTPTIAARMSVRGTEGVKQSFEDIKKSGEQTFGALRNSARSVGAAVDTTVTAAARTTTVAVNTAKTGLGVIGATMTGLATVAGFVVNAVLGIATAIAKGAVLVAGAAVGGYTAMKAWTISIAEGNNDVMRQAQALGMSVEALSKWQAAVRIAGGDAKAVNGAFESMRGKMIDVAKGVDGADTAFRQLNLQVRNTDGSLKGTEALFDEAIDQLAKIDDEGRRSAAAYDIFGTSAASLLPVLRRGSSGLKDLQRDAERYGTALTTAQSAENDALIEKKRRMEEALRGASNRISDAFLPVFTNSALAISEWLAKNGDKIELWANIASERFRSVVKDVKSLFADGTVSTENSWLMDLYGPAQTLKNMVLDLLDAMGGKGGMGNRNPWMQDFVDSIGEAWETGKALLALLGELTGTTNEEFSMAQAFRDANAAMSSFRDGLQGETGEVVWASNVGNTVRSLGDAVGVVAGIISDNRDQITSFATDLVNLFGDGMEAIRGMLNGDGVSPDNAFAWLPGMVDTVLSAWGKVSEAGTIVWDKIVSIWDTLYGVGQNIINIMDSIAKALGLGDWQTLGIILVIAKLTGALSLLSHLATIFAGLAVFVNNFVAVLVHLWPMVAAIGAKVGGVVMIAATAIAGFLGIPVWVVLAIGAAIAAIIALLIVFQGDIGKVFQFIWDVIKWPFEKLWELNKWVWGKIGEATRAAGDAIISVFKPLGPFFEGIINFIGDLWNGFWGLVGDGGKWAWDGIVSVWGGVSDWFGNLIGGIGKMWDRMWENLKNGAANAWNSVKSFFGFGGDEPDNGGSGPSYDVGTARVPGADGAPMHATIHGGERILTVAENKKWGSLLDSLKGLTTLPQSEFAFAPEGKATGSGGSSTNVNAHFGLNGRNYGGFQATGNAVRELQSGMRRSQRIGGIQPRWRPA